VERKSLNAIASFLALLTSLTAFGEFGLPLRPDNSGQAFSGNVVFRAVATQTSSSSNYLAVGRAWNGSQYVGVLKSGLVSYGFPNGSFTKSGGWNPGEQFYDFAGAGYDNLCNAVTYAYDGFIAACRSLNAQTYYNIYLIKVDTSGNLVSSFGTGGIVDTGLGGSGPGQQALIRGIAYNSDVNASHHGVVAIVGALGNYGSTFHPFIATYDQQTGAAYGSSATVSSISGTAVSVAYDTSTTAYYVASTETSATNHFYVNKFYHPVASPTTLTQINASTTYANSTCDSQCSLAHCQDVSFSQDASLFQCDAGPYWDTAVDFTTAISGGAAHSVPNTIAVFGSDVVVGGSNKVSSSTPPWRCALVALNKTTGSLDTSFGSVPLSGGTNSTGISLFSHEASPSNDCIVNNVLPKGGTQLFITGTAYTAGNTNYDYLAALFNSSGALVGSFGNGTVAGTETFGLGPSDDVLNATTLVNSGSNAIVVGRSSDVSGYQGGDVQYFDTSTGGIAPTLQSLSIDATVLGVAAGNTSSFTVSATFSDSSEATIASSSFNWSTSDASKLTVSGGTVTPLTGNSAIGSASITSSIAGISANSNVTNPGFTQMGRALSPGGIGDAYTQGSAIDTSGNNYLVGYTNTGLGNNSQTGSNDYFVAKYNTTGTLLWVKQLGATSQNTYGNGITVDSSGNSYITGSTSGGLYGNSLTGGGDYFLAKYNTNGALQWLKQWGVTSQYSYGTGVTIDASGNSYVTGYTTGGLSGNSQTGYQDYFLAKIDSSGTLVWLRQAGRSLNYSFGYSTTLDSSGNIIFAGATSAGLNGNPQTGSYDYFIGKYDPSGNLSWLKQLGTSTKASYANSVATDSSGNSYLAGYTTGGLNGNSQTGSQDCFVAKYDSSGNLSWLKQLGATSKMSPAKGITVDASGNSYTAGYTTGGLNGNTNSGNYDSYLAKYDTSGNLSWVKQLGGASQGTYGYGATVDASGNSFVAGYTTVALDGSTQLGLRDLFIAKYNSSGTLVWSKQTGAASQTSYGSAVSTDASGNSYVAGYTVGGLSGNSRTGAQDFFVAKYNASGALSWLSQMGVSTKTSSASGVSVDPSGNTYVAGSTSGGLNGNSVTGSYDYFIAKYSASGSLSWLNQLGVSTKISFANGVAVDASGNSYITGSTSGGLNGNSQTGFQDYFIAKYDTSGNLSWLRQVGVSLKFSYGQGVSTDASGNSYIGGYTTGGLNGNPQTGTYDYFLAKYDPSGNLSWLRQVGLSFKSSYIYGVSSDTSGNTYATGYTTGGLNGNTQTGPQDYFIAKYDTSGNLSWLKQLGVASQGTGGYAVSVDTSGNSYITGITTGGLSGNSLTGNVDFFLAKYDVSGNLSWLKQSGVSSQTSYGYGVSVDTSGNAFVTGYSPGALSGNPLFGFIQYFLIKYNSAGLRQ
jgi:hypothetical protein